jgi:hypothetical protein
MKTARKSVAIHQAIHGYRDGHELLASSMPLTSSTRRTMLALSDLSGDGSPQGFEDYLSGYPLDDAGMYAFARTWYAPEMSRPGCVWTHTLLIDHEALGRITELAALRRYFCRPESGRIPSALSPIRYGNDESDESLEVRLDGASYEIVVRLYGQAQPVVIFGSNSRQYEDTFIQVWSQQWERLRRAFAFCTGALEPRLVEKRPFDLQVIPNQRQRKTLRAADKFSIVTDEDILRSASAAARVRDLLAQTSPLEEQVKQHRFGIGEGPSHPLREGGKTQFWREIVAQDLLHRNAALHKFVDRYDVDIPARRSAYRDLIECWALVESVDGVETSLRDLTSAMARAFPKKSEAAFLKKAALCQPSIVHGAKEVDLLHELLTLPYASAFDAKDLEVASRAETLFREGSRWCASSISWLLTTTDLNDIGRVWSTLVLEHLSVQDLSGVFTEDRALFARLLRDRPSLMTHVGLWQQGRELQRAAVRMLPLIDGEGRRQDAINALVAANAAGLVSALVQELGPSAIQYLLTGLDQSQRDARDLDEWQWSTHLRGHEGQLVDWLNNVEQAEPWTLAFVVALLGVHSNQLGRMNNATFQRHLRTSSIGNEGWAVDFAAYCLTIALHNYNGNSGPLAVAAFPPVHEAALRSRVSRRAWQWLGPALPHPGWLSLENWDNGEKLRRALIDSFLRYRWESSLLWDAATTEPTRSWFVRYCASFDSGQDLLRRSGLR